MRAVGLADPNLHPDDFIGLLAGRLESSVCEPTPHSRRIMGAPWQDLRFKTALIRLVATWRAWSFGLFDRGRGEKIDGFSDVVLRAGGLSLGLSRGGRFGSGCRNGAPA